MFNLSVTTTPHQQLLQLAAEVRLNRIVPGVDYPVPCSPSFNESATHTYVLRMTAVQGPKRCVDVIPKPNGKEYTRLSTVPQAVYESADAGRPIVRLLVDMDGGDVLVGLRAPPVNSSTLYRRSTYCKHAPVGNKRSRPASEPQVLSHVRFVHSEPYAECVLRADTFSWFKLKNGMKIHKDVSVYGECVANMKARNAMRAAAPALAAKLSLLADITADNIGVSDLAKALDLKTSDWFNVRDQRRGKCKHNYSIPDTALYIHACLSGVDPFSEHCINYLSVSELRYLAANATDEKVLSDNTCFSDKLVLPANLLGVPGIMEVV